MRFDWDVVVIVVGIVCSVVEGELFMDKYLEFNNRCQLLYLNRTLPVRPMNIKNPMIILLYDTGHWEHLRWPEQQIDGSVVVTYKREMLARADIVVFLDGLPLHKISLVDTQRQSLALMTLEAYQPQMVILKQWPVPPPHYLISYSQYSDVLIDYSYAYDLTPHEALDSIDMNVIGVIFQSSHCTNQPRNAFYDAIDMYNGSSRRLRRYGGCYRNNELTKPKNKQEAIAKYPFCIAIENVIMTDYMTEKLIECVLSGSIPVYIGAPNFKLLLHDNRLAKIIITADSPAELAYKLNWILDYPMDPIYGYMARKHSIARWRRSFKPDNPILRANDLVSTSPSRAWYVRLAEFHRKRKMNQIDV